MDWLNYHHLLYFWTVARTGSVARAAQELHLAQSTISGQIGTLEDHLGEQLFTKSGRNLVLTDVGQTVYGYAEEIFTLGRELMDTLQGRPTGKPLKLRVGVTDVMPKLISHRLLEPVLQMGNVQLICNGGKTSALLADLAVHRLDLVLADAPLGADVRVKAYNHLLGECGITFFGTPPLRDRYRRRFPRSLDGAPLLLPTENTLLRQSLNQWFAEQELFPSIVAEFEDSALLKAFGEHGAGIFAAPTIVDKDIRATYGVSVIGRTQDVVERFYAITIERRLKHPAARVIREVAQDELFD